MFSMGIFGVICSKKAMGSSNLAIRKRPLLVFGKIGIKSRVVRFGFKSKSKSSEMRSVKSLELILAGISFKAFLVQKRMTMGVVTKPIKSQLRGFLKIIKVIPPARRAMKRITRRTVKGGLLKRCFSWASLTREFWGS